MPIANFALNLLARTRLPRLNGRLRLAGLHAAVDVLRDEWGVPHIYAAGLHDLFFAQGFVHAQDRLFQMDFNRRLVAGRLSEVLGPVSVPLDRWMRCLTMRRVAEFEVRLLDDDSRAHLQAYANGINAAIAQGRLPLEFSLLRYRPEPWVIADSLAWIKMMAWSLSVNWEIELLRARLIERLGPELAAEIEAAAPARWPTIVPRGSDYSHIGEAALERARQARPFIGPSPYEGLGSNNWVIGGERSTTGLPLLANDMHLSMTAPAIWYENHLCGGGIEASGVIFPGLPGIIAGHNQQVAWGLTNGFPDVQDLYIERLRRNPDGSVQAEYNHAWEPVHVLKEVIKVKGGAPATEEVLITRHGPIINSLAGDFAGEEPLALRWTALEPDTMVAGMFAMLRAGDVHSFHQALRQWSTPAQNVVYADTQGNIAYTFAGKIPLRARGRGRAPVPGWTDEYEWSGTIPFDGLPHLLNPPQGYIASANNRAFSDDYPLPIELEPISGDRAQRIGEMLLDPALRDGQEQIDLAFIQKMHYDQVSPSARVITRAAAQIALDFAVSNPETELHHAVKLLKAWDGTLSPASPAAALYKVFSLKLAAALLNNRLLGASPDPADAARQALDEDGAAYLLERILGKGPMPTLAEKSFFGEGWLTWLTQVLAQSESPWYGPGGRDVAMRNALQAAWTELTRRQGPDPTRWRWGRLHRLTFRHALSANPTMAALFNRGPFPIGGDHTTIWASGNGYHTHEDLGMVGPPYRMIIDLADLRRSVSMLAPGQSGNPASPYYSDQITPWFKGRYHPMLWERKDIDQAAKHRLRLEP